MRSISRMTRIPALLLFVAAAACGGGQKGGTTTPAGGAGGAGQPAPQGAEQGGAAGGAAQALPAIPAQPAAMPEALLATVSVGDPQGQLSQVAAYADAVNPGFGAMIAPAQMLRMLGASVGAPSLDGVDLSKPIYLLLLDPQKGGGQALLVVGVSNEATLAGSVGGGSMVQVHDGFAAVGKSASLTAASPYALSNLIKNAPPKEPHVVVYMSRIMDSYGAQFEAQMRQSMGSKSGPEQIVAESIHNALRSIDRIEASLEASATNATASVSFFPVKGSSLATWSGSQKPAAYDVAARLPAGPWLMVAADDIDWSPLAGFFTQLAQAQGKPELGDWFGALGHEAAFALYAKKNEAVRVTGVVSTNDAAKMQKLLTTYIKTMAQKMPEMDSMKVTAKANGYSTGGAKLAEITVKPGPKTDAADKKKFEKQFGKGGLKSYVGVTGSWLVFSVDKATSAKKLTAKLVRSAKAKKPKSSLGAQIEGALSDSKARKESGVVVFDMAAIAPNKAAAKGATVTLGLGFEGSTVKSRISVPPEVLKLAFMMRNSAP